MHDMPLAVWADTLEDAGQDTTDLRAWIAVGACGSGDGAAWLCDVYALWGGGGSHSFSQALGCPSLSAGDGRAGGHAGVRVYPLSTEPRQPAYHWQAAGAGLFDQYGSGLSYVSNG